MSRRVGRDWSWCTATVFVFETRLAIQVPCTRYVCMFQVLRYPVTQEKEQDSSHSAGTPANLQQVSILYVPCSYQRVGGCAVLHACLGTYLGHLRENTVTKPHIHSQIVGVPVISVACAAASPG